MILHLNRLAITIACVVLLGCSGSKNLAISDWQPQPVVVDGKADEWQQPLRYANSDTKLNYSISNDDGKLYFCFTNSDRRSQSKMMMGGVQIRIDAAGKDDIPPVTLIYPIPGRVTFQKGSKEGDNNSGNNGPRFDRQQLLNDANTLLVSGFPFAKESTELPLINKYGVIVATSFTSDDRFIYEAAIPLENLNLKGKDVDITITIKGIPKDQMPKGANGGAGGGMRSGAGAGGMGGGGMRGGAGGMRSQGGGQMGASPYQTMFVDQKINVSIRLADKL